MPVAQTRVERIDETEAKSLARSLSLSLSQSSVDVSQALTDPQGRWFFALLVPRGRFGFPLRFRDDELEDAFVERLHSSGMGASRSILPFLLFASSLFFVADLFFVDSSRLVETMILRAVLTLALVMHTAGIFFAPDTWLLHYEVFTAIVAASTAALVGIITSVSDAGFPWGVILFAPVAVIFLRPRIGFTIVISVFILVTYMLVAIFLEPVSMMLLGTFSMAVSFVFSLALAYNLELLSRRLLVMRRQYSSKKLSNEKILEKILPTALLQDAKEGRDILRSGPATIVFLSIPSLLAHIDDMSPEDAVETMNTIFSAIDDVATKWSVTKLETVTDIWLGVCGLPAPLEDHTVRAAGFAVDALAAVDQAVPGMQARIGIHAGHTTVGVVGLKRRFMRAFGSTVNTGARLMAKAGDGEILITKAVRESSLGDDANWLFLPKGEAMLKGLGSVKLYRMGLKDGAIVVPPVEQPGAVSQTDPPGPIVRGARRLTNRFDRKLRYQEQIAVIQERLVQAGTFSGAYALNRRRTRFSDPALETLYRDSHRQTVIPAKMPLGKALLALTLVYAAATLIMHPPGSLTTLVALALRLLAAASLLAGRSILVYRPEWVIKVEIGVLIAVAVFVQSSMLVLQEPSFGIWFLTVTLLIYSVDLPSRTMVASVGCIWTYYAVTIFVFPGMNPDVSVGFFVGLIVAITAYMTARVTEINYRRDFVMSRRVEAESAQYARMAADLLPQPIVDEINERQREIALEKRLRESATRSNLTSIGTIESSPPSVSSTPRPVQLRNSGSWLRGSFRGSTVSSLIGVDTRNMMVIARSFPSVIALEIDIKGFTQMSAAATPEEIHAYLDNLFRRFDLVVERAGVWKCDTTGDSYLVCAGLFGEAVDDLVLFGRVLKAALSFQQIVSNTPIPESAVSDVKKRFLQSRVGIARGSLMGGVFGQTVPKFNVWGPAVTNATELESACPPNRIHVAGDLVAQTRNMYAYTPLDTVSPMSSSTETPSALLDETNGHADLAAVSLDSTLMAAVVATGGSAPTQPKPGKVNQ